MVSHSAVPLAYPLNDSLCRVYFGVRDAQNRSQTAFFDLDLKTPLQPKAFSQDPILKPGRMGTFDESGAMPSCLVYANGQYHLYYTGWSLGVTVPFYYAIGLAVTEDLNHDFEKVSEAPLIDRHPVDPLLVASPAILVQENQWQMWYVSGREWQASSDSESPSPPRHYYHIRDGSSVNGFDWQRKGHVAVDFATPEEYAFSRPCVLREESHYTMWYAIRGAAYRLGMATSVEGKNWIRQDDKAGLDVSESGWDSEMICYPFVFEQQGYRYMLYNGNGYGKTGIGLAIWE